MSGTEWKRVLEGANACGEHHSGIVEEDIDREVASFYYDGDFSESQGVALVELKNGQFAVIEEWEDTTGHG